MPDHQAISYFLGISQNNTKTTSNEKWATISCSVTFYEKKEKRKRNRKKEKRIRKKKKGKEKRKKEKKKEKRKRKRKKEEKKKKKKRKRKKNTVPESVHWYRIKKRDNIINKNN